VTEDEASSIALAENSLGILKPEERRDAESLLALCRAKWGEGELDENEAARQGGRLVEYLARRSASAMPYAALGRALLADLRGAEKDKKALLEEFAMKMSLLGL
jgi:hypothetical protein